MKNPNLIPTSSAWIRRILACCSIVAFLTLAYSAGAQSMVFKWNNNSPDSAAANGGGMAYSKKSGSAHLYWVHDGTTAGKILILNAATGASAGTLPWPTTAMSLGTSIPSGTYYVRGLCNDSDGYVYGCNYIGVGNTMYILKWDPAHESSNPTVVWSGSNTGASGTLGQDLAVYGTGNSAVFVISTTSTSTTAGGLIIYNNGTSWVSRIFQFGAAGPAATALQCGLSFIDYYVSAPNTYRFYSKFSGTSGYINEFTLSGSGNINLTMTLAGGTTSTDPLVFATSGAITLGYDPTTGLLALSTRPNAGLTAFTNILATIYGGAGTNIYGPGFLQSDIRSPAGLTTDTANPGKALWGNGAMFTSINATAAGIFCYDVTAFKLQSGADPTDVAASYGGNAVYTVKSGGSSLTYQWKKDGVSISNGTKYAGATTATLTVKTVDASDNATASVDGSTGYSAVVTGVSASTWTSAGATLTVTDPLITSNPSNVAAPINGSATFTIGASGSATLQYQWQKGAVNLSNGDQGDGTIVSGATTGALTLSNIGFLYNNTTYSCNVTSTAAGTGTASSTAATLTVTDPSITGGPTPASQNVTTGSSPTIGITAAGSGTVTYQWYQSPSTALSNDGHFAGTDTATLTITSIQKADASSYYCVVSEAGGPNSPQTSSTATVAVFDAPAIVTAPSDTTVTKGQIGAMAVVASGDSITYQWKKGASNLSNGSTGTGSIISGATTATLSIANFQTSDADSYTVVVHNGVGSDASASATMSVQYTLSTAMTGNTGANAGATIAVIPVKSFYNPGDVVQVTATAAGANYQLDYWTGSGSGSATTVEGRGALASNPITMTINDNVSETANFALYSLTIDNSDIALNAIGQFDALPDNDTNSWTHGSATTPLFGTDYQFCTGTGDSSAAATVTGTFTAVIAATGFYDVYEFHNVGGNRATNAPITINGTFVTNTYRVNQQSSAGSNKVASVYFTAGQPASVVVGNNAADVNNGTLIHPVVIVDAIELKFASSQPTPVAITSQPADTSANAGDTVTLSVSASGTTPSYQWKHGANNLSNGTQLDGSVVSGATTASLTISGIFGAEAGAYTCIASNAVNSVSSSAANVTVTEPVITSQPTSVTAECNSAGALSVTATGTSLTYQWFTPDANGTAVTDATNATLSATAHGTTAYVCVVTSLYGTATSSNATITSQDTVAPVVTLNGPTDVTVECHGTFSDPGASVADDCEGASTISSATGGSADLNAVGDYALSYTATDGSSNAGNVVTRAIHVRDSVAPVITVTIGASTACTGSLYSDPGATADDVCDSSITVNTSGAVNTSVAGDYTLTYSATDGSGNSATATRVIGVTNCATDITITGQPQNQLKQPQGTNVLLSVMASGSPLTYQWYENNVLIPGATGATNSFVAHTNAITGTNLTYYVVVSNAVTSVQSSSALVTVLKDIIKPALIVTAPLNNTRAQSFTVKGKTTDTHGNDAKLKYFWTGITTPGTSPTYSIDISGVGIDPTKRDFTGSGFALTNPPSAGTNTLTIWVEDLAGNASSPAKVVKVFWQVPHTYALTISGDGTGSVKVSTKGAPQEVVAGAPTGTLVGSANTVYNMSLYAHQVYSIKYTPDPKLDHPTAGTSIASVVSNAVPVELAGTTTTRAQTVTFTAGDTDTSANVSFARNRFVDMAGTYNGVFTGLTNVASSRLFVMTISPTRTVSGYLMDATKTKTTFTAHQTLNADGSGTIVAGGITISGSLAWTGSEDPNGVKEFIGSATDGSWTAALTAEKADKTALPTEGFATMQIPGGFGGSGFATVHSKNGTITAIYTLADDDKHAVSFAMMGNRSKNIPQWITSTHSGGLLFGNLIVDDGLTNLSAPALSWIRPSGNLFYPALLPAGFTNSPFAAVCSPFLAGSKLNGTYTLNITGGGLANDITSQTVTFTDSKMTAAGKVKVGLMDPFGKLKFTFQDGTTPTHTTIAVGALLQNATNGVGFFIKPLGTDAGNVSLTPQ